jgi:hypothetical protein
MDLITMNVIIVVVVVVIFSYNSHNRFENATRTGIDVVV